MSSINLINLIIFMLVKINGQKFLINSENVKGWRELEIQSYIIKQKRETQKNKIVKIILENRKMVKELLNKSDNELKKIKVKEVFIDRYFIQKTKLPFIK